MRGDEGRDELVDWSLGLSLSLLLFLRRFLSIRDVCGGVVLVLIHSHFPSEVLVLRLLCSCSIRDDGVVLLLIHVHLPSEIFTLLCI